MKKKFIFALLITIFYFIIGIFAFNWPQENINQDSFYSVFGQLRGSSFCNSLIFSEPSKVTASEAGAILTVLGNNSGEMGWFESPLGNTVIIAHDNDLLSIYGNLTETNIDSSAKYVQIGKELGYSGSSGWQHGQSSLEFQIVDTKKNEVINPRLLMPHVNIEKQIRLYGITAVSRSGEKYDLRIRRNIPTGTYTLYRTREQSIMPYKTTVSVNGAAVETITFDLLTCSDKNISVTGKYDYSVNNIYPNTEQQLLAEVNLSAGRNTLNITASDINGAEYSVTYILDVK